MTRRKRTKQRQKQSMAELIVEGAEVAHAQTLLGESLQGADLRAAVRLAVAQSRVTPEERVRRTHQRLLNMADRRR